MLAWLRKFAPAIFLAFCLLAILDATLSSLATCHPITEHGSSAAGSQENDECTAFAGPVLTSLIATVDFLDYHGEAVTGVFTIVLALFTAALWHSTDKMWDASERQFRLAKETGDRQAREIQEQLRLTRENIEFARLEFNAAHRPQLVIRESHILIPTGRSPAAGVRFLVANAGSGPADIVESFVILEFNDTATLLPLQPPDHSNSIGPIRIEPGNSIEREFGSNINFPMYTNEQGRHMAHPGNVTPRIWLRGFIVYLDNNRVRRRMAFCRGYDFKDRRFRAGDDPNYEYSD
jgi:hypothetical protein